MALSRSLCRMIDASLNRAAEGLRVAEDVCRFHWSLPGLSSQLRDLRHRLLALVQGAPGLGAALSEARDAEGDVGRSLAAGEEEVPGSFEELAARNVRRAREAIRSLEEAARVAMPSLRGRLAELRYELYGLEKGIAALGRAWDRSGRLAQARLYLLVTAGLCRRPPDELDGVIQEALAAGVDAIQLREKSLPDRELLERARRLRELAARAGALFLVNDRPDIARLSGADGVHLGRDDLPPGEARAVAGDRCLLGVSTHSVEEARGAGASGADYIGVGPVFETRTKAIAGFLGLEGLRQILAATDLPAFAIGGIGPENVSAVVEAGARRIAVSSAVLGASDVKGTVERLLEGLPPLAEPGPGAGRPRGAPGGGP